MNQVWPISFFFAADFFDFFPISLSYLGIAVLITLFLLALLLLLLLFKPKKQPTPQPTSASSPPLQLRDSLFTTTEIRFLLTLQKATNNHFILLSKISLAKLVEHSHQENHIQKIKELSLLPALDFLLLNPSNFSPLVAIYLLHSEEESPSTLLKQACKEISLPLLTFQSSQSYTPEQITTSIHFALNDKGTLTPPSTKHCL